VSGGALTDSGDQSRFREQLVETEALLETVLHGAPVGFAFLDPEARFMRVNDEMAAACGGPAAKLVGAAAADVFGSIWSQCESSFRHVLTTAEPLRNVPVVGPAPRRATDVREWLTSYYPIRLGGAISGVGIVAVDVTTRMRSERIRAAVMSQVTDGVYTEDADGRLTSLNRAASRMLGWTEAELRGRRTHDVIHFQGADGTPVAAEDCPVRAAARTGRVTRAVHEAFTRRDGRVFHVACTAVPLRLGGSVEGTAVIFRDVNPSPVAERVTRVFLASADERVVHAIRTLLDAHEGTELLDVVATPADAVAGAQARRPDVAVVDSTLPDLDGVETVGLIQAEAPSVKTILLVDDDDRDVALAALDAGCSGVLEKRRIWADLVAAVEAAHHGGTVMSRDALQEVISSARRQKPERPMQTIGLTGREQDVLACISEGLSNKQVAEELGVTVNTVRNHVQRILYKLHAHSKLEAVVTARHEGMLPNRSDRPI
jgi:PAS domain S-box-containing protein